VVDPASLTMIPIMKLIAKDRQADSKGRKHCHVAVTPLQRVLNSGAAWPSEDQSVG
jgi:hypothetical protein